MIRHLFTATNLALLSLAAFFLVQTGYQRAGMTMLEQPGHGPETPVTVEKKKRQARQSHFRARYGAIAARNLFNVKTDAAKSQPVASALPARRAVKSSQVKTTRLRLKLKGFLHIGSQSVAVIEEKRKQAFFYPGQEIFETKARLESIDQINRQVTLIHNGQAQLLQMADPGAYFSEKPKPQAQARTSLKRPQPRTLPGLPEEAGIAGAPGPGQLQLKARFRNGNPDGFLLHGIRPDSLYSKMGLQNGDILKKIDGETPDSEQVAREAMLGLSGDGELIILRSGAQRKLFYQLDSAGQPDTAETGDGS